MCRDNKSIEAAVGEHSFVDSSLCDSLLGAVCLNDKFLAPAMRLAFAIGLAFEFTSINAFFPLGKALDSHISDHSELAFISEFFKRWQLLNQDFTGVAIVDRQLSSVYKFADLPNFHLDLLQT